MYFKDFWQSLFDKSKHIPVEELKTMTASQVVRKRKLAEEQPSSTLRRQALMRVLFVEDVNKVVNKTFEELADEYLHHYPAGVPEGVKVDGETGA